MSRPSVRVRPPAPETTRAPQFAGPDDLLALFSAARYARLPQRLPKPKPPLGIPAISTRTAPMIATIAEPVIAARIRYTRAATSTVSRIPIISSSFGTPSLGAPHQYPLLASGKLSGGSIPDEHRGSERHAAH